MSLYNGPCDKCGRKVKDNEEIRMKGESIYCLKCCKKQ